MEEEENWERDSDLVVQINYFTIVSLHYSY